MTENANPNVLSQWVVYDHPSDYPQHFVVRRWSWSREEGIQPSHDCSLHHTLEDARAAIPDGLFRLPRHAYDDPVILEVWI